MFHLSTERFHLKFNNVPDDHLNIERLQMVVGDESSSEQEDELDSPEADHTNNDPGKPPPAKKSGAQIMRDKKKQTSLTLGW